MKAKIAATSLPTYMKTHVWRLSKIAEQLYAQNAILHKENMEIKSALGARKEMESGKWKIWKGITLISTEEMDTAVEQVEAIPKQRRKRSLKEKEKDRNWRKASLSRLKGILRMWNIN